MTTGTLARVIQCKHCSASTRSSVDVARMAGWRMFDGTTQGGKPLNDVVCPSCAGTAPDSEAANAGPSWRVRCSTCDWMYEDEYDEGPLDAKAARSLAYDHQCEPYVQIAPPSGDQWYDRYEVDDKGLVAGKPAGRPVTTIAVPVLQAGDDLLGGTK